MKDRDYAISSIMHCFLKLTREPVSPKKTIDRHFEAKTTSWLTTAVSSRDGLVLSKAEFMDNVCLRYGQPFKSIPPKCDGCSADFTVQHALSCMKGGLVTQRHKEIRDRVGDMASFAWTGVVKCALLLNLLQG